MRVYDLMDGCEKGIALFLFRPRVGEGHQRDTRNASKGTNENVAANHTSIREWSNYADLHLRDFGFSCHDSGEPGNIEALRECIAFAQEQIKDVQATTAEPFEIPLTF